MNFTLSQNTAQWQKTKIAMLWPLLRIATIPVLLMMFCSGVSLSQNSPTTASHRSDILQFLDQTINWYRQIDVERQIASEPDDVIAVNDNRPLADQIVRSAFDFARAEADFTSQAATKSNQSQNPEDARYQSLMQLAAKLEQQVQQAQAELQSDRQKVAASSGNKRRELEATIAELQSEIDLANARRDIIRNMADFVGGASSSGLGTSSLRGQIDALAHTVSQEVSGSTNVAPTSSSANPPSRPAPAVSASKPEPTGIWGLTADLFSLSGKVHTISDRIKATDSLADAGNQLRSPLIARLTDLTKQGDAIARQADAADANTLAQQKKELDSLTAQFKQISAAVLPLSKQPILLDLYKRNLMNWQGTVKSRYRSDLRGLFVRLLLLAVALGLVLGAAELWRRAIFRYVHDTRRRYQFLLIRKIVMWFSIGMVVAFAFASQLGSVATFAGLITAGVAVALQNVILSVAGYFFLIGKFGIRVGDRVQIAGVTGEVVEVGLVRLHLMELSSTGSEIPTGRVVAFSNSIVFQPASGLFKQIPGTNFMWHEITVTLPGDSDYHQVEKNLREVVEKVFADYKDDIEGQRRQMERSLGYTSTGEFRPRTRLLFTGSGLEAVIRYPVILQNATEIDDRITREVLDALGKDNQQKSAGQGAPTLKLRTDVPPPAT
jgi:small-conductance mechanosensitive channel/HPt (histidine-containing phosphotransfer) domain-containing protein